MNTKKTIGVKILLYILITICISYTTIAQVSESNNKSFIAFFKDSLIKYPEINEQNTALDSAENRDKFMKELFINFAEIEIPIIIEKNYVNMLNVNSDTIWTLDTIIAGIRCNVTAFNWSSSILSDNCLSGNTIYLNCPEEIHKSRSFLGILFYKSKDAGWILNGRAK